MSDERTISAHAKLNLTLAVAPPEPPDSERAGWHRIESRMHALALHDTVRVRAIGSGPSRFERSWAPDAARPAPIDWPIEQDLVFRAHALMEQVAGRPLPAEIRVRKRIPAGGGLGGGSSDAAAVMRGLNLLFDLGMPMQALREQSASLGSDLAFFLDTPEGPPRPAMVTGFGDRIERLDRAEQDVLLFFPPLGCDTGAVYRAFDALAPKPDPRPANPATLHADTLFNDLGPAARSTTPVLGGVWDELTRLLDRPVHLTGSGSTLFVLMDHGRRVDASRIPPDVGLIHTRLT